MSLWCEKYRPSSLLKLDYHKEQAKQLKNLVGSATILLNLRASLLRYKIIFYVIAFYRSAEEIFLIYLCMDPQVQERRRELCVY